MEDIKKIFKFYNLKTWKNSRFQIFLNIITISVAAAIMVSLGLIVKFQNIYTKDTAKISNDGDINITMPNSKITTSQMNALNKLKDQGYYSFVTSYKEKNTLVYNDNYSSSIIKLVDSKNYPIFSPDKNYENYLSGNNIVISKSVADKLNLKIGDSIKIYLRIGSNKNTIYKVAYIMRDSSVMDESIFGVILINKNILDKEKLPYTPITNVHINVNSNYGIKYVTTKLKAALGSDIKISTSEDIIIASKELLKKEFWALDIIRILVIILAGVGVAASSVLLNMKREKDYVLLNVLGMKEEFIKKLVQFETLVISVIGSIIGTIFGLIITLYFEKSIFQVIGLKVVIFETVLTVLTIISFTIIEVIIFTLIPITLLKKINAASFFRGENKSSVYNSNLYYTVVRVIVLLTVVFSIYIWSLKTSFLCISILVIFTAVIYVISLRMIKTLSLFKRINNKITLLAFRNIIRQKTKFSMIITVISASLIMCGLIVNITSYIIPEIMKQYSSIKGYNIMMNTTYDNEKLVTKTLRKNVKVKDYARVVNVAGKLLGVNGVDINSKKSLLDKRDYYNSLEIKAVDVRNNLLSAPILGGRWFKKSDSSKNYIVLGNDFAHAGIGIDDLLKLKIQNKIYNFKVIGVEDRDIIYGDSMVYISFDNLSKSSLTPDVNLEYVIKSDKRDEKPLIFSLGRKTKSLVVSTETAFGSINRFIQNSTYVFVFICCISIFSAVCLIVNMLLIINYERLKEFVMLNILGAKTRHIVYIVIKEGIILGLSASIIENVICQSLSYIVMENIFEAKYLLNLRLVLAMTAATFMMTILCSVVVVKSFKIEKCIGMLRME